MPSVFPQGHFVIPGRRLERTTGMFLIVAARCPVCGKPVCVDRTIYQSKWEPLEEIAKKRMREVGVAEERIGMLDVDNDYRLAVFHPKQLDGGGVHPPTGRINLDAGLFKPGLLAEAMPADVSSLHDAGRASVKQDAIIAHEFEEGIRGSHEAALEHAPETGLSIKEEARRLLRAQRDRSL